MRRVLVALVMLPLAARADDEAQRLRDLLRRTTTEMRALQDQQSTLQASLDEATQQRDQAQHALADRDARIAQLTAAPPPNGPPAVLSQLQVADQSLRTQNAALQAGLAKWQAAYAQAAGIAQARDAAAKQLGASAAGGERGLKLCEQKNAELIRTATDILHLYATQDFRSLLLKSYEPVVGFEKVRLENMIQDYEDRIRNATFYPAAAARAGMAAWPPARSVARCCAAWLASPLPPMVATARR